MGTPDVASELDWEHVYDVHAPRLRRLIRRKVEAAAIDDVLQETFLRAFKSRHTMDRTRPMKPWLNTIALRTIADVQRGAVRTVETLDVDTECDELALACDALDDELLTRAKQNGIKHAFASLNSRHRRLLQLVDIEGMPYEYVARHEQMTTDAVKAAVARARSNFRASYVVFTEKSGLFGAGALVGPLALKVRLRWQRYQDFVAHHAAGVGAATLTVAVVASATIPNARSAASHARNLQDAATNMYASIDIIGVMHASSVAMSAPDGARTQQETAPGAGANSATQRPAATANIAATMTRHDSRSTTQVDAESATDVIDVYAFTGIVIDCTTGTTGPLVCATMGTAPAGPEPAS